VKVTLSQAAYKMSDSVIDVEARQVLDPKMDDLVAALLLALLSQRH
jgi:hypothetical protein